MQVNLWCEVRYQTCVLLYLFDDTTYGEKLARSSETYAILGVPTKVNYTGVWWGPAVSEVIYRTAGGLQ